MSETNEPKASELRLLREVVENEGRDGVSIYLRERGNLRLETGMNVNRPTIKSAQDKELVDWSGSIGTPVTSTAHGKQIYQAKWGPLPPREEIPGSGRPSLDAILVLDAAPVAEVAHALFDAALRAAREKASDDPDYYDLMLKIQDMDTPNALAALRKASLPSDMIVPIADVLALLVPHTYAPRIT
ncbi:hypothetical protein ACFYNX_27295 [Streptomyces sp. NPDC007872]|uniref:hypothetical protein n=1 Tax=Streptomyces sp. NPDC007872 TaxID=3364782 RepID=UPI003674363D